MGREHSQVIENFRRRDASSLSLYFLVQWFLGDLSNLIGAILTGQLATQILVAIYFAGMDAFLWGQWFYFGFRNKMLRERRKKEKLLEDVDATYNTDDGDDGMGLLVAEEEETLSNGGHDSGYGTSSTPPHAGDPNYQLSRNSTSNNNNNMTLNARTFVPMIAVIGCSTLFISTQLLQSAHPDSTSSSIATTSVGRSLLGTQFESEEDSPPLFPPNGPQAIIGYIIGIISAMLYLGSRLPQIFKNFKRRTTDGLSPLLFFCALMGNLTYSVSIFLMSIETDYLLSKAPWIIGSAGVVVQDLLVLMQFVFFRYIFKNDAAVKGGESSNENSEYLEQGIGANEFAPFGDVEEVDESTPITQAEKQQ